MYDDSKEEDEEGDKANNLEVTADALCRGLGLI
jgi:hypothetical protein